MNLTRSKEQREAGSGDPGDGPRRREMPSGAPSGGGMTRSGSLALTPSRHDGSLRPPLDPERVRIARRLSQVCALVGMVIGLLVLGGWVFNVTVLKSISPTMVSTKPNAALAFTLIGTSLLLLETGGGAVRLRTAAAVVLAAVVGAIGVLTLIEYAFGVDLGIDQILFHESARAVGTGAPARMAVAAAASLMLASGALALVAVGRVALEQITAGTVLAYVFSALLSYLYGAETAQPAGTTKISALSIAAFLFLGVALLVAKPERGPVGVLLGDEPGGLMARWLLVAAAVMLPLLGALRLAGEELRLYSGSSGVGIMVIAALGVLVVAVAVTAGRLNGLGRQRTTALARLGRSEQRLRRTLDDLVQVQENERRTLAMDLHDDALPALSAVNLQLELARERCDDDGVAHRLERAEAELRAITSRLRYLTFDLLPEALAREGLGGALRHRLERMHELTGIEYELRDRIGKTAFPHDAAILYRSTLEALRNVTRHAQARTVRVTIEHRDDRILVSVADDGVGLGPAPSEPGHMGLSMMRHRLELAGGGVDIRSECHGGTIVTVWVPGLPRDVGAGAWTG